MAGAWPSGVATLAAISTISTISTISAITGITTITTVSALAAGPAAAQAAATASAPRPAPVGGPPLVLAPGSLLMPVRGIDPARLQDNYSQPRGDAAHGALDIMAPRGTPVVAVADGRIAKLFTSKPGGLTVYQFDASGRLIYYYAHLDRYAPGLKEGQRLRRGDPVGTVGSTGNASPDAPHLHFAVHVLGAERAWWKGTPVNPYPLIAGSLGAPTAPAAHSAPSHAARTEQIALSKQATQSAPAAPPASAASAASAAPTAPAARGARSLPSGQAASFTR